MKTTITILCDNCSTGPLLVGEHGFSLLIERDGEKILFDTGPGMSLPANLNVLGKDLKGTRQIFLSHGHYDHTGGLKWAIEQIGPVEVVAHPDVFARHMVQFAPEKATAPQYIGCPFPREELERLGARFRFLDHTREAGPGLWFVTGVVPASGNLIPDNRLVMEKDGRLVPDRIPDDASILLQTDSGPVLMYGCAHVGPVHILDHVQKVPGIQHIHGLLGGTHLMFGGPEAVGAFVSRVKALSIDVVGVSHCTGLDPAMQLARELDDRFAIAGVGRVFEF